MNRIRTEIEQDSRGDGGLDGEVGDVLHLLDLLLGELGGRNYVTGQQFVRGIEVFAHSHPPPNILAGLRVCVGGRIGGLLLAVSRMSAL